jgi:hypothetical protein
MKIEIPKKNNQITKKSEFEKLPAGVQKSVFTFFNLRELGNIASVNKTFRELSNEEIERLETKYKDNVFYTVGKPIQISDSKRHFSDMLLWMKPRKEIPNKEIYESFLGKDIQKIRLFKTEHEALEYSRSLRTGNQLIEGTQVYQPAIFKVLYLDSVNDVPECSEDLVINPRCGGGSSDTEKNDQFERTAHITYFEVSRSNVMALEGVLKFHLPEIGTFKTYGSVDYSNFDFGEKNESSSRCTIM